MRTKILVGLMFFSLLVPTVSLAATKELAPEFNTLCWHKKECDEMRAQILKKDLKDVAKDTSGWLNEEPCQAEGWGKCLPSGITVTEVAFGGKKQFANLGEFLKTNYDLAITIAGILAVIMIIVAGVQWVSSGGNSEMITSAKKRIGGALTGLLIAYLSYTILNTINPATVNLRLPQTFLLRPSKIVPQYCREATGVTNFAKASDKGEKVDPKKMQDPNVKMVLTTPDKMACGDNYFLEGGGGATCMGSACSEKGTTCLPITTDGEKIKNNTPNCEKAQLVVHYTIDPSVTIAEFFKPASVAVVEGGDWMSTDYSNPFWAVCETAVSKKLYIGDKYEQWDVADGRKTIEVPGSPYNEYYLFINNLSPYISGLTFPEDHWSCYFKGDRVVGFVFKSELGVKWEAVDINYYVSPKPYIGAWKSISENGYITFKQLENGILINANLDSSNISQLYGKNSLFWEPGWLTEPAKLYWDGNSKNGELDPSKTPSRMIDGKYEKAMP